MFVRDVTFAVNDGETPVCPDAWQEPSPAVQMGGNTSGTHQVFVFVFVLTHSGLQDGWSFI